MSDNAVSGRILTTLDRFALNAYDEKTQPELKLKGISESNTELCACIVHSL